MALLSMWVRSAPLLRGWDCRQVVGHLANDLDSHALALGHRPAVAAHNVEGLDFLDGCGARLQFALKTINKIRQLDRITEKEKEQYDTFKSRALAEVHTAVSYMRACATFFEPANLAKAETWAQSRGKFFRVRQFEVRGATLHAKGPGLWENIDLPKVELPPFVLNFTETADDPVEPPTR